MTTRALKKLNKITHEKQQFDLGKDKVVIYLRVSTQEQADQGFGLDNQLELCKKFCEAKSFEVVNVFSDLGISGTVKAIERNGFNQALEAIANKEANTIITYAIDRIARDLTVAFEAINDIKSAGGGLVTIKDNLDTTSAQFELFFSIFASIASIERKTIVSRTAGGRRQKAKQNKLAGGSTPLGYKNIGGDLVKDEDEIQTVKKIFELRDILKLSFEKIAKHLNENNYKTKRGGVWNSRTVYDIYNNKKYRGIVEYVFSYDVDNATGNELVSFVDESLVIGL